MAETGSLPEIDVSGLNAVSPGAGPLGSGSADALPQVAAYDDGMFLLGRHLLSAVAVSLDLPEGIFVPRYTATFHAPDFGATIDPRDLGTPEGKARCAPITAGQHILNRFDKAFGYRKTLAVAG
ncbi:hypothetical protein J8J14_19250 [Roseomonas sp. SSH11]|uniref:Uncharacterized protein n=1 Tax=Pararoseomonas baculiformis TaxID=2820812 RepID=A0ABS4AIR3_9PROT|nr:hypothetical protein [Pararoseomonas baculiformis]MBP0446916.1 hypothetical protein [Pararoseomonas baculiformis]